MKVDLVVNTMIQQIDRNLQQQVLPALSYRAGELLRGRVMLAVGDRPQIRLDNGALLNAIPAGDVLLSPGASVTLRVSGQMDGQLVMQLLDQELTGERSAPLAGETNNPLAKMGLEFAPQGKAVMQAMAQMRLPMREETARQALETMTKFPDIGAEKAVFLVANRIAATAASVDALNGLIDAHVMTGDELTRLADILKNTAPQTGSRAGAEQSGGSAQGNGPAATQPDGRQPAGSAATVGQDNTADPAVTGGAAAARQGSNAAELPPIRVGAAGGSAPLQPGSIVMPPSDGIPATATVTGGAPASPPGSPADDMMQLQSLMVAALGMEQAEQYANAAAVLDRNGMVKQAVALALDGPLLPQEELAGKMEAFASSLPQDAAPEARQLVEKLIAGLGKYLQDSAGPAEQGQAAVGASGLARVLKEINHLFARLDSGDGTDTLMQAATAQKARVTQILSDAAGIGVASPDAARQMDRIANHVQLIGDISQYAYQQIPVELNGRQKTVELYVLNKGKNGRKVNPDHASILIALDTESLGHIETLINVSQKNLRLRFGVERPELAGFVESHMTELGQAMQVIGFRLSDMHTQLISHAVTPLTVAERVEPEIAPSGMLDRRV